MIIYYIYAQLDIMVHNLIIKSYPGQLQELSRGCDILVGTPGRLVDMLERYRVSLEKVLSLLSHILLEHDSSWAEK